MRIAFLLVAFALLTQPIANAQTNTADGIAAIHEGDYVAAVRILRPLVEDPSGADPLAEFFLATLYHSGKGVIGDEFRACGLYLRAAVPTNPFASQSRTLALDIHQDHPLARSECAASLNRSSEPPAAAAASSSRAPTPRGGIEALARGDYQTTVSELNPLVESWPVLEAAFPDFVMAALYENGQGVAADPMRACTLYVRASLDNSSPLSRPADVLMQSVQVLLSQEQFQRCVLLASVGLNHQFQPVMFMLEPGHWISLEIDTAAITYQWKETRKDLDPGPSGVVFLPVKHTELTSHGSPPERRHFIEFFSWMPGQKTGTWRLHWRVFEVVRERLVSIVNADLRTISAERPPTGSGVDTSTMARLRVNDEGLSMWEVLEGPDRDSDIIETEAERQERRDRARAHEAALERVNWDAVRDVRRVPALAYAGSDGCGNVHVYGWSEDRTEAITVSVDKDALGLFTTPATLDLSSKRLGLGLSLHVYERPVRSWPFCSDLVMPTGPAEMWRAVSGSMTITLSPPGSVARSPHLYRATIRLVDVEFVSATGVRVKLPQPVTLTAVVGGGFGG